MISIFCSPTNLVCESVFVKYSSANLFLTTLSHQMKMKH